MAKLVSRTTVKKEAKARLGKKEYQRRLAVAEERAQRIASDRTWFPQDHNRNDVLEFAKPRLEILALQLNETNFTKLEQADTDTVAALLIEGILDGVII